MMRQPDAYVVQYRDGEHRIVGTQTFERLVRGSRVAGFWRVWLRKEGEAK